MKSVGDLIKELENSGVFIYKNNNYYCTGYNIDITIEYVELHKKLILLR